jgi:ferredoxin--NADP+ reductase
MSNNYYKIVGRRELTDVSFVLEMDRNGISFEPGQHLLLGKAGDIHFREYSIYSGTQDKTLDILVKEVDDGLVSQTLHHLGEGDEVDVQGPMGFFTIEEEYLQNGSKFLLVASGTGISPFHSMVKSIPELDYQVLHGIRYAYEAYDRQDYEPGRYIACTSRDDKGDFHGRVTDYIRAHDFDANTHCYLCGNYEMIREAMQLLEKKGIPQDHFHAEVYF